MGLRARSIAFRRKSPIRELLLANGKLLFFLSLLIKQRGIGKSRCMRQLSPGKISMLYVSSEMFCTSGTGVGSGVASMTCGRGVGVTFGVGFGVVLGSSAVF